MSLPVTRALRIVVVTAVLAVAVAAFPPISPVRALPIEGYPTYDPQSRCSPTAKTGTVMLQNHLLRRYRGSGSSGIARSCSASGRSEHKEGRAFDWRLSANSARDRRYANNFISRLRATDAAGNRNALARRMGIMYVIWNDHIWSASKGYVRRGYLHGACKKVSTCGTTLRHRDHMHISLTWAGARAKTSWYQRQLNPSPKPAPKPAPKPTPEPAPRTKPAPRLPKLPDGVLDLRRKAYTAISVPADGNTVETRFKLQKGVTYSLVAAGLYTYGAPNQVGDAVCTWARSRNSWIPHPVLPVKRRYGRLALEVNGALPFGKECRGSHTYRTQFTPKRDGTVKLRVLGDLPKASGRLTVVIGRKHAGVRAALPTYRSLVPAPSARTTKRNGYSLLAETVSVPASRPAGTYTTRKLRRGVTYRVTVSGVVDMGGGVRSDGQCLSVGGAWYKTASIDRRVPDQDHGNLYLNGKPFWTRGSGACETNTHSVDYTPDVDGRLRLDLWDPLDHDDNTGDLTVKVQRVTPIVTPEAGPDERPRSRGLWLESRDWFEVNARDRQGTTSTIRFRKGEKVQVVVRGTSRSDGYDADASCVKTKSGWLETQPDVLVQDTLNVWVDGEPVKWRALGPTDGCSSENRYTTRFTVTEHHGPLRISVFDLDHRDNRGSFEVTLLRAQD